jgi:hypothetical protein
VEEFVDHEGGEHFLRDVQDEDDRLTAHFLDGDVCEVFRLVAFERYEHLRSPARRYAADAHVVLVGPLVAALGVTGFETYGLDAGKID